MAAYILPSPHWILRDAPKHPRASLLFHLEANDYFGTLATILSLFRQELAKPSASHTTFLPLATQALETLEDDLLLLQRDYAIVKNKKHSPQTKNLG